MAAWKVLVVGAGGIAGAWLPVLRSERLRVVGIVDLIRERAEARAREFCPEAQVFTDLRTALVMCRPDIVLDLTVPEAHCQVTCAALKAGCHVLGEKPMADSLRAARTMVRTAERMNRLYMVSQSRRWEAQHDRIRRTIAAGRLGTLTTVNCDFYIGAHFGGFRDVMESPLILDMAIHHFDLARHFTGADPVAVYCHEFNPAGSWYRGNAAASCIFEMTDGIVFTYRGSWCAEGCPTSWNGDWRLIGTRGTLICAGDQEPYGEVTAGTTGFTRPVASLEVAHSPLRHTAMRGALRELLAYLRRGVVPQTECHDNIKSLAMVFAAIESARRRARVRVTW
ncbi:MAG: Gfo/Idh/MocA family oxidoreductase [bacterium]|nr:Gfo/Idh/MocA family oxidoreductase [bacterium]